VVVPVGGAVANLSDLVLVAFLAVAGVAELTGRGHDPAPGPHSGAGLGLACLAAFGAWVALSALWGAQPGYALAKGAGVVALACAAWCLARSRVGGEGLADAWLLGAAAALVATLLLALVPTDLREQVLYGGGAVHGLPFPRVRGPFTHPNLLGEYAFVSAILLWWRWPTWAVRRPALAWGLAAGLAAALVLSVPSAMVAVGVGWAVIAWAGPGSRPVATRAAWATAGLAVLGGTLAPMVWPMDLSGIGVDIYTGGGRPVIWASALDAVRTAPVLGVGAAPYLAATAEVGVDGPFVGYWDAHSAYLSVLGQFGPLGMLLFLGGLALIARSVRRTLREARGIDARRLGTALFAAAAGILVHWTVIAGEDFRHLWALTGVALAAAATVRQRSGESVEESVP
jgi:hypothetical protein